MVRATFSSPMSGPSPTLARFVSQSSRPEWVRTTHDIGPGSLQGLRLARRGRDRVAEDQVAVQDGPVPSRDLRRHGARHPDPEDMPCAIEVLDVTLQQDVTRPEGFAVSRILCIGEHHGKPGIREDPAQQVDPVVEVVIAQRGCVVAERVHGKDHGMRPVSPCRLLRREIAEGAALKGVAIVEE